MVCRRTPGSPARWRHQIHAAQFPTHASRDHAAGARLPARARRIRHLGHDQAAIDLGVPAALAVQGICGRWSRTVHEQILFRGKAATDPGDLAGRRLRAPGVAIKSGLRSLFPHPASGPLPHETRRKPAQPQPRTHEPVYLSTAIVGCRTLAKTA